MSEQTPPSGSRRSILKTSGALMGGGLLVGATTGVASASDFSVDDEVYLVTNGYDIPGYESCDLDNFDYYTYKTSGTIVDGPCSGTSYWKVDLDGYPTAWFHEQFLEHNNGGP